MNIIVPLAGKDANFESRGMIKPLTKVDGKEIIKIISESRPFSYENAIFIVLMEHQEKYKIADELIRLFGNKIKIIILDKMTDGSPQSILRARDFIDNDEELIIDLADQYLDLTGFLEFIHAHKWRCDGIIPTFEAYHWNQGYMTIEDNRFIRKISEKDKSPISTHSTACISYFKRGRDFVKYAEQMIAKKRTAANGVYLPSLIYNEMIEEGKKILSCPCELIINLGKVEGVSAFEQINRPLKWKSYTSKHKPDRENKIILHRGYKGEYPENSKISFEKALKEGKSFETDIRVSQDGIGFMIHDDSLDRLFDGQGKIRDMTSEELGRFHYKEDSSQGLCSLREMCELIKNNPGKSLIFIHIKELKDIPKVIEVLKEYDFDKRIRFFAVDEIEEEFREIMKTRYSEYQIGLYLPENSKNYDEELFRESDFIWADEVTFAWMTREKVELAHSLGKPFYAISPELISASIFNVDIEKRWKELLEINVDGVCIDKPKEFEEFLKIIKN